MITLDPAAVTLAQLAATRAGASRVFHRHRLDFCCNGSTTVAEACAGAGLDPAGLLREIDDEAPRAADFRRWDEEPVEMLLDHILERFHGPLRAELPRVVEMARTVERVHADKPSVPRGLAGHLGALAGDLEIHMQKEERMLFPLIRMGGGTSAVMPVRAMELEHEEAGLALARTRELTGDFAPPAGACATWRALYLGLEELERELMEHIHLENNVLHPRAVG